MLHALFVLVKAVRSSIGALVWSFLFLVAMQLAVGMILQQVLAIWIEDASNDIEARRRVFDYFGSFTRMMLTMFEITLANWVVTCRSLMKDVSEWLGLFYVVYRCLFCFGVLKVITAYFIAQTNRALAKDDDLVTIQQEYERMLFSKKVEAMFAHLDTSHDGYLTWEEFEAIKDSPLWRAWGDKLGLPMGDLVNLFEMLARSDGKVSANEFFNGMQRMKGYAKAVDMVWLLNEVSKMMESNKAQIQELSDVSSRLSSVSSSGPNPTQR